MGSNLLGDTEGGLLSLDWDTTAHGVLRAVHAAQPADRLTLFEGCIFFKY